MDELLALMSEEPVEEEVVVPKKKKKKKEAKSQSGVEPPTRRPRPAPLPPDESLALSVDDRLGVRMLNRKISGSDLFTLITEMAPYHSPSQLAAMSLKQRHQLLVTPPPPPLEASTLTGRTNLVTIGIVFANSGTRVSSASGRGFCILQIGATLATGPTLAVMLFGTAYSSFCKSAKPGHVVALVGPKLIPPRENSNNSGYSDRHAMTLAVSTPQELRHVADARDFGLCAATVSTKNERGQWVSNAKTCGTYVDTRICAYCDKHRNFQAQQQGGGAQPQQTNGMQQLREQVGYGGGQGQKIMTFPKGHPQHQQQQMQQPQRSLLTAGRNTMPLDPRSRYGHSKAAQSLWQHQQQQHQQKTSNPLTTSITTTNNNNSLTRRGGLTNSQQQQPSSHITSTKIRNDNRSISRQPPKASTGNLQATIKNPYATKPVSRATTATKKAHTVTPSSSTSSSKEQRRLQQQKKSSQAGNDWLEEATRTKPASRGLAQPPQTGKRKKVNTDTAGFSGSVPVPKPSRMFATRPSGAPSTASGQRSRPAVREDNVAQDVVAHQRLVAEKMREQQFKRQTEKTSKGKTSERKGATAPSLSSKDSFYASLGDVDLNKARNAQSKFATEVAAEEYVRSRKVVTELEEKEEKEISKSKKKKTAHRPITVEYFCVTCQRASECLPTSCQRQRHNIQTKRSIVAAKTVSEKRLALADRNAADGGMTLGAGLEWSKPKWNRFT